MNGIAASRNPAAAEAREATSHNRTPIRTCRFSRSSHPHPTSPSIKREAVAMCNSDRRAISETVRVESSNPNDSTMYRPGEC
jgi:hypothetical protein